MGYFVWALVCLKLANPGQAPILRTKFVTKKEINKCVAKK